MPATAKAGLKPRARSRTHSRFSQEGGRDLTTWIIPCCLPRYFWNWEQSFASVMGFGHPKRCLKPCAKLPLLLCSDVVILICFFQLSSVLVRGMLASVCLADEGSEDHIDAALGLRLLWGAMSKTMLTSSPSLYFLM